MSGVRRGCKVAPIFQASPKVEEPGASQRAAGDPEHSAPRREIWEGVLGPVQSCREES